MGTGQSKSVKADSVQDDMITQTDEDEALSDEVKIDTTDTSTEEVSNPAWGSAAFIPTFENAAYGIEWTKDDNDIIRIGNAKFHRELPCLPQCLHRLRHHGKGRQCICVIRRFRLV